MGQNRGRPRKPDFIIIIIEFTQFYLLAKSIFLLISYLRIHHGIGDPWPRCPDGVKFFQKFLESEYSGENLKFWIAVKKYKTSPGSANNKLIWS